MNHPIQQELLPLFVDERCMVGTCTKILHGESVGGVSSLREQPQSKLLI